MNSRILFHSLAYALIGTAIIWMAWFVWLGLPGHFPESAFFGGKGPIAGPEYYACLERGGAFKFYLIHCDFFEYVRNRLAFAVYGFFLAFLSHGWPPVLFIVFWILFFFWLRLKEQNKMTERLKKENP